MTAKRTQPPESQPSVSPETSSFKTSVDELVRLAEVGIQPPFDAFTSWNGEAQELFCVFWREARALEQSMLARKIAEEILLMQGRIVASSSENHAANYLSDEAQDSLLVRRQKVSENLERMGGTRIE